MSWLLGDVGPLSPAGEVFAAILGTVAVLYLMRWVLRMLGLGS